MNRASVLFRSIATAALLLLTFNSCEKLDELTGGTKPGKISGVVRDSISNLGLAGVAVTTLPPTVSASTDADGVFLLDAVDKGEYVIRFAKDAYVQKSMDVSVAADKNTVLQVVLAPAELPTGSIQGTVVSSADSRPIPGASVTTIPATVTVVTDTAGVFTITQVPVRSYTVNATASGYQAGTANVQVTAGAAASVTVTMAPVQGGQTGTIKGTVTHSVTGAPVADADVTTQPASSSAKTDANGNYQLNNVPAGTYSVNVSKSGFSAASFTPVTLAAGGTQTVNLALIPAAAGTGSLKVTVVVSAPTGQIPLPTIKVFLTPGTRSAETDSSGQAFFTALPYGQYTVRCEHPAIVTAEQSVTISSPDQLSVTVVVTPAAVKTGTLQGTVRDANTKAPVAGATVTFHDDGGRTVTTNAAGVYTAADLPVGHHSVTVSVPAGTYATQTKGADVAESQTATLDFDLQPVSLTTVISGKVLNALKLPVDGVLVELSNPPLSAMTDAAGIFTLKGNIPAGLYQLKLTKSGYDAASAMATVGRLGDTVWIGEVPMSGSGGPGLTTISGTAVSIVSMKGVANTTVTTVPATSTVSTGSNGSFSIPNVTPGTYGINLSHAKYIDYRVDGMAFPLSYALSVYMFYGKYTASQTAFYPMVATWQEWNKTYWGSGGPLQDYGSAAAVNRFGNDAHARRLSGAQYMMTTPFMDSAGATAPVMVSFWTKLEPGLSALTPLAAWSNSAGAAGWFVAADNEAGKLKLQIVVNNTGGTSTSFDAVYENDILGKWIMVTAGFRQVSPGNYQAVLYLNGAKKLEQTMALPNANLAANQLVLGRARRGSEGFQYLNGIIDDVRLFRSFLTGANIEDLFLEE